MLCRQGDRRRSHRWEPGCYGRLGASFARPGGATAVEPGCYDAPRASFVRRESRERGCKSLPQSRLEGVIAPGHGVIRRSESVLCRGRLRYRGATDAMDVKRASFAAARFVALPPQVVRAQELTPNRHSASARNTGRYSALSRGLDTHIPEICAPERSTRM